MEVPELKWSAQFSVAATTSHAVVPHGDKILLPPSALEQMLSAVERQPHTPYLSQETQLPYPLTLRLVNPTNNNVVHCGIMEFSAGEGQIVLSQFITHALGLESKAGQSLSSPIDVDNDASQSAVRVTAHAKQLAKGTFVKLRPLESYDQVDWKPILEEYLRKNFTTLTRGEILRVPTNQSIHAKEQYFEFLIDELLPQGDGICIVDTDLEVDIEALNEEQARETVRKIADSVRKPTSTGNGSSVGGSLDLFKPQVGRILQGEYVDYEIPSWDRSQGLEIELNATSEDSELDLYASPFGPYQRAKPREDENVWDDMNPGPKKRIRLSKTNEDLSKAETILVSVHSPQLNDVDFSTLQEFTLTLKPISKISDKDDLHQNPVVGADEAQCKNCRRTVPKARLVLHENFCLRNNILCPQGCGLVFQKGSPELENHWHCPKDDSYGNGKASQNKHDRVFHTPYACPNCDFEAPSLSGLAHHRSSTCKGKLILCRFCHLVVPQGTFEDNPIAEAILSGLTPHEFSDSGRTTECHICQRIVRLRDMDIHLKNHDRDRKSRRTPRMCKNVNCGRTLDGVSKNGDYRTVATQGNDIGVCNVCFGPLYSSTYDPEGKALRRRVERRYLSQLLAGCSKNHCHNQFCKTGKANVGTDSAVNVSMTTKDALPIVKPFVDGLFSNETPLHFCVDETSQKRRDIAGVLAAEGSGMPGVQQYGLPWCIAALEAENGDVDSAREWLRNFAPSVQEEQGA